MTDNNNVGKGTDARDARRQQDQVRRRTGNLVRLAGESISEADLQRTMDVFIDQYGKTGNFTGSADFAVIHPSSIRRWIRDDREGFAARFVEARERSHDVLRAEIHRRAVEGGKKKRVTYERRMVKGPDGEERESVVPVHIEEVEETSDILLIFEAKARMPAEYRDRIDVNVRFDESTIDWLASIFSRHIRDQRMLDAILVEIEKGPPQG